MYFSFQDFLSIFIFVQIIIEILSVAKLISGMQKWRNTATLNFFVFASWRNAFRFMVYFYHFIIFLRVQKFFNIFHKIQFLWAQIFFFQDSDFWAWKIIHQFPLDFILFHACNGYAYVIVLQHNERLYATIKKSWTRIIDISEL